MKQKTGTNLYFVALAILLAVITVVFPTACDVEYAVEHPTYISASDQVYLDIKEYDGE